MKRWWLLLLISLAPMLLWGSEWFLSQRFRFEQIDWCSMRLPRTPEALITESEHLVNRPVALYGIQRSKEGVTPYPMPPDQNYVTIFPAPQSGEKLAGKAGRPLLLTGTLTIEHDRSGPFPVPRLTLNANWVESRSYVFERLRPESVLGWVGWLSAGAMCAALTAVAWWTRPWRKSWRRGIAMGCVLVLVGSVVLFALSIRYTGLVEISIGNQTFRIMAGEGRLRLQNLTVREDAKFEPFRGEIKAITKPAFPWKPLLELHADEEFGTLRYVDSISFDMSLHIPIVMSLILGISAWKTRGSRYEEGCCRRCGYDMRATPQRCPECGARSDRMSPMMGAGNAKAS